MCDILQVVVTYVRLFDAHSRVKHGFPRIKNGFPRIRSAGGRRDTPTFEDGDEKPDSGCEAALVRGFFADVASVNMSRPLRTRIYANHPKSKPYSPALVSAYRGARAGYWGRG